jgi:hypothetical protein
MSLPDFRSSEAVDIFDYIVHVQYSLQLASCELDIGSEISFRRHTGLRHCPTRSLTAQFWHRCTEWSHVWVSTKPLITEEIWRGKGLNTGLPKDTLALYPLLPELMLKASGIVLIYSDQLVQHQVSRLTCCSILLLVNPWPEHSTDESSMVGRSMTMSSRPKCEAAES